MQKRNQKLFLFYFSKSGGDVHYSNKGRSANAWSPAGYIETFGIRFLGMGERIDPGSHGRSTFNGEYPEYPDEYLVWGIPEADDYPPWNI